MLSYITLGYITLSCCTEAAGWALRLRDRSWDEAGLPKSSNRIMTKLTIQITTTNNDSSNDNSNNNDDMILIILVIIY